jgi:hypothetical protein
MEKKSLLHKMRDIVVVQCVCVCVCVCERESERVRAREREGEKIDNHTLVNIIN